jgi:YbbR domain-containing protein
VRILRFFFGNWTLKIGALALAVILYVGMVALQSTQQWPGQIPIQQVNQPANAYLVSPNPMPNVSSIRYIAPADVRISADSFSATIDLKDAKVGASDNTLVKVQLVAEDPRIQIIDYQPQQVRVSLDPITSKSVPVKVVPGTPPAGLSLGPQTLSVTTVQAIGASSLVARVVRAEAQVRIDASGLDVNEELVLSPVDANDQTVENVQLSPGSVTVRIQIGSQLRSQTVPVTPVIKGSPAAGYYITSIDVNPVVIGVSGEADALAALNGVASTQPVSIAGATGDVSVHVALNLPAGVEAPDVSTVAVVVHLSSPPATRTVTIGLALEGGRPDRVYAMSTVSMTVTLGGAAAALNAFDTSSLVGSVSVASLEAGTHTVAVKVTVPPGIKVVSQSLSQITVTITIPPSPSPTSSTIP